MKRPSFQFYPADWRQNAKLRRCSLAARGAWMEVMCLLHDADEYGVLRWPLADIAQAAAVPIKLLHELAGKGVLKGSDKNSEAFVFTPTHARKDGDPVVLVEASKDPCWYSSRLVTDEYIRRRRGANSRFDGAPKQTPNVSPKHAIGARGGDGPTSSSSSTEQEHELPIGNSSPSADAEGPPAKADPIPYQAIVDTFNRTLTRLPKARSLTPKRRTLIRSAWQAAPERRSVEFWEALAAEYEADDFTNGTGPYLNGHEGWRPSIDYLLRADVVTRTFERAMDRLERGA